MHIYQLLVLKLVAMWLAKSKSYDYREAMLGHVKRKNTSWLSCTVYRSVLLDNGLVTALNETLFERQRLPHFSIDPTSYTGTDLISPKPSGEKASSTIAVKDVENILRFDYQKDLGIPI